MSTLGQVLLRMLDLSVPISRAWRLGRGEGWLSANGLVGLLAGRHLRWLEIPPLGWRRRLRPTIWVMLAIVVAALLGVPDYYDLDRLDLEVEATLDSGLEDGSARLLANLRNRAFVAGHGLLGDRLLAQGDPEKVIYSILLFERQPEGNALLVQTDNLEKPFDINQGVKLELGSTAKLRTLAHYLELVNAIHQEFLPLGPATLRQRAQNAKDPITRWAAVTLLQHPGMNPRAFLEAALDRAYSASPNETFLTGGGAQTFANLDPEDNGRVLTVGEAFTRSVNLVFIRLMRDLVLFHRARLPYDADLVLSDPSNPDRLSLLRGIAEEEARQRLTRAHEEYRSLGWRERITRLLGRKAGNPRDPAILYFAWNHGSAAETENGLARWLSVWGLSLDPDRVHRLARAYGNPSLNLSDYGFLLGVHPLDVWTAGELAREPGLSWNALWERSADAREVSSSWLFATRNREAQDLRLRTRIEEDAFARMTPYWRRLGFPFERLVPSLATAIGSSCDRPLALAQLMGIILNDGVYRATVSVRALRFAVETPYHTVFDPPVNSGEQVMAAAVAQVLQRALERVVDQGTASRLAGAFVLPDGTRIPVGGKTGSGDNRFKVFARNGEVIDSRPVNRTATFVFYIGDRYFGVISALVPGPESGKYGFTSALPVTILKILAPALNARFAASGPGGRRLNPPGALVQAPLGTSWSDENVRAGSSDRKTG